MRNFRKYDIWIDAVTFVTNIYNVTNRFPSHEKYGLSNQLQRASVSIASNIAEGSSRISEKEFAHFLRLSLGSAFEVETQLTISNNVGYLNDEHFQDLITKLFSIERQLNGLISTIRKS